MMLLSAGLAVTTDCTRRAPFSTMARPSALRSVEASASAGMASCSRPSMAPNNATPISRLEVMPVMKVPDSQRSEISRLSGGLRPPASRGGSSPSCRARKSSFGIIPPVLRLIAHPSGQAACRCALSMVLCQIEVRLPAYPRSLTRRRFSSTTCTDLLVRNPAAVWRKRGHPSTLYMRKPFCAAPDLGAVKKKSENDIFAKNAVDSFGGVAL